MLPKKLEERAHHVKTRAMVQRGAMDQFQSQGQGSFRIIPTELVHQVRRWEVTIEFQPCIAELNRRPILGSVMRLGEGGRWHDTGQAWVTRYQICNAIVEVLPVLRQQQLQAVTELLEHVVVVRPEAY